MADEREGTEEAKPLHSTQIGVELKQGKRPDDRLVPYKAPGFVKRNRLRLSNAVLAFQDRVGVAAAHEIDTGTAFNLVPVLLGIGILIYFTAPAEPGLWVLMASFSVFCGVALRLRVHGRVYFACMMIAVVFAGMLAAQLAVIRVSTPNLERQLTAEMSGLILALDQNQRGSPRYLVRPDRLGELSADKIPARIRVSAAARHEPLVPGQFIQGLVRLQPVSGPAYPGSYDFSFFAWFRQLGGSGFFMGAPQKAEAGKPASMRAAALISINQIRVAIEKRIKVVLPGGTGGIAIALITGNRAGISADNRDSLRRAGLAHVLAISGLHMALVTLTVIWLVRALFSWFPAIVQHYPVKKWATIVGFCTASLYLMLSGASIATQRAWLMISVMLLAVIMDRRAITLRSVAVSALLILLVNPESLLSPGFQMSFAAVTALVAGYEAINRRKKSRTGNFVARADRHWFFQMTAGLGKYFSGIAITSLIAGFATAMFAAWHFHQIATLGLLGNLLAMPLVALLVMPLALFSMLLMPYGFEYLALRPMALAIDKVVAVAQWVEGVSPAGNVGLMESWVLLSFGLALIILTLFKTWFRYAGLVLFAALPLLINTVRVPDILISENGRAVAIKTAAGKLALLYPRRNRFVSNIWLKAWSGGKAALLDTDRQDCDRERCKVRLAGGLMLHVVYDPDLLKQSCNSADIIVAPRLWWVNCRGGKKPQFILKRWNFEQYGTHALYFDQDDRSQNQTAIRVETALGEPVRPWQRRVTPPD